MRQYIKNKQYTSAQHIPPDFFEDFECQNNLPPEDYDIEGGFVGRNAEIKEITEKIESEQDRIITLTGAGGFFMSLITDETGAYVFENVPPGTYSLQVEAAGFETRIIDDIEVTFRADPELGVEIEQHRPGAVHVDLRELRAVAVADPRRELALEAAADAAHLHRIVDDVEGPRLSDGDRW